MSSSLASAFSAPASAVVVADVDNEIKHAFHKEPKDADKTTQKLFPNRKVDYPTLGPEISQNALIDISRVQSSHIPHGYEQTGDATLFYAQDGSTHVYDILPHEPLFEITDPAVISANLNGHGQQGFQSVSTTAIVTSSFNGASAEYWSQNCRWLGYCGNQTINAMNGPQNLVKVLMTGVVLVKNNTNQTFYQNQECGVWLPYNNACKIQQRFSPELPKNTFVCEFAPAAANPPITKVGPSLYSIDIKLLQKALMSMFTSYLSENHAKVKKILGASKYQNELFHAQRLSPAARLCVYIFKLQGTQKAKHERIAKEMAQYLDLSEVQSHQIECVLDKALNTAADKDVIDGDIKGAVYPIIPLLILMTVERCASEMRLKLQANCEPRGGQCRAFLRPPGAH